MSRSEPDDLYIFCMYAYYLEAALPSDDLRDVYGEDRLVELEAAMQVDPRCLRFGPHAVVIPWGLAFHAEYLQAVGVYALNHHAG